MIWFVWFWCFRIFILSNGSLFISQVKQRNTGVYKCVAQGPRGPPVSLEASLILAGNNTFVSSALTVVVLLSCTWLCAAFAHTFFPRHLKKSRTWYPNSRRCSRQTHWSGWCASRPVASRSLRFGGNMRARGFLMRVECIRTDWPWFSARLAARTREHTRV